MKRFSILHPFFFTLYSIWFIFYYNIFETSIDLLYMPTIVALICLSVVLYLLILLIKDKYKAGLVTLSFTVLFFTFGRVHESFRTALGWFGEREYIYLFLLGFILIFICLTYPIIKSKRNFRKLNLLLNVVTLILLMMITVQVVNFKIKHNRYTERKKILAKEAFEKIKTKGPLPDIYYVILDGYAGFDTCKNIHGFDNSSFKKELEKREFFVAQDARSNYPLTYSSVASSMNMNYIDPAIGVAGEESTDTSFLARMIAYSTVAGYLKTNGYKFINFSSGWGPTNRLSKADQNIVHNSGTNEYVMALIHTTLLKAFIGFHFKSYKVKVAFSTLPELEKSNRPRFILYHLPIPHPPNVFDKDGNIIPDASSDYVTWKSRDRYIEEMKYANKEILKIFDRIIKNSKIKPVIIIQSDHGSAFSMKGWENSSQSLKTLKERTGILNALLVPKECRKSLYDTMSPVNNFRVVFNCLFSVNAKLHKDKVFWSTTKKPYRLKDITDTVRQEGYDKIISFPEFR